MLNSLEDKTNILLSVILGILCGLVLMVFLPFATTNIYFIIAVPIICLFFILMIVSVKSMLIVLLFVRALIDPLLNVTKFDILAEDVGAGGVINLAVIIIAISYLIRNPKRLLGDNFLKSWIIFLFICSITVIFSPVPSRSIKLIFNLVSYMSMAVLPFFLINNLDDKKFWLKILFFSSLLPSVFANLDLLRGGEFYIDAGIRIKGTFMHPNILSFYLVLIVALIFYMIKSNIFPLTKFRKSMLWIYMVNLFVLIVATKTRSAWISCWGLFFVYGLLKEKKYIIYSIVLPVILFLNSAIISRTRDIFSEGNILRGERLNSFEWRIKLWKSSFPWIKMRPILGYGLGSFGDLSRNFFPLEDKAVASHNIYLELLFETGMAGLLSYIVIYLNILKSFYSWIKKGINNISVEYAIIFSYVIGHIIACFSDNMFYYLAFNWYFWFFVGIMLRSMFLYGKNNDNCNNSIF